MAGLDNLANLTATAARAAMTDSASARALQGAKGGKDIAKAAKDFEAILLNKVMEEMRRSVPESDFLSDGTTQQVQDIFWMYLSDEVAKQGGVGLWKELVRQADPQQAAATPATPATVEHTR